MNLFNKYRKIKIFGIKIFGAKNTNKWYQYWLKNKNNNHSIFSPGQKLAEYRFYTNDGR